MKEEKKEEEEKEKEEKELIPVHLPCQWLHQQHLYQNALCSAQFALSIYAQQGNTLCCSVLVPALHCIECALCITVQRLVLCQPSSALHCALCRDL